MGAQESDTSIWKRPITIEWLNQLCSQSMVSHLGMEFVEIGNNFLKAEMPVDDRTRQPFGLLHGGASVALMETVGSAAATSCLDDGSYCLGIEVSASHVHSVRSGTVQGVARPIHIGSRSQVWEVKISDEDGNLVSTGRLTLAVVSSLE